MKTAPTFQHLHHIHSPADLRQLPLEALPTLCQEIRENILYELAQNPGHLASSLGAVELTVALHYVYETPYDRIVWDVGHQAYVHKILTGRRERFSTNRKFRGIRPFPSPEESEYDTFACGHASNSISAALGMSVAAYHKGEHDREIVAVIGDGAMSGGLAFEGLNNASETPNNLLIILNDNDMSISDSVGGMKQYLHYLHTSSFYNRWRSRIARCLERAGLFSEKRRHKFIRFNNAIKALLQEKPNVFEGMNIRYFGPSDGHKVIELVHTLQQLRQMKGPKLLHLNTRKGCGYEKAEADPIVWHAPGKFDAQKGERVLPDSPTVEAPKFQDVFGETLLELAQQNERIVGVTPAMMTGCSMEILAKAMPHRAYDVGIAEGHAVTFSGGMAKDGLLPYCNIYSAFAQRAYDHIIHDVALLNLRVVFCLDRAGIVGEDGPTHHGAFDIAALRTVPNLILASPYDEWELRHLLYTAQLPGDGAWVIRYPRGTGRKTDWRCPMQAVEVGTARTLQQGNGSVALLSFGPIGTNVADAIAAIEAECAAQDKTIALTHIDLRFVKPLDKKLILEVARTHQQLITIEDASLSGGVGSAILELLSDEGLHTPLQRIGMPDFFVEHGSVAELHQLCAMDTEAIKAQIRKALHKSCP